MSTLIEILSNAEARSVFQPIVDLGSGSVVAYEALGRLAELDELCRRTALRTAIDRGILSPLTLFVNVEPEVLHAAPLDELLAIAEEAPGELQLVLEITERDGVTFDELLHAADTRMYLEKCRHRES